MPTPAEPTPPTAVLPIFAPEVMAMRTEECGEPLADLRDLAGAVVTDRYAEDGDSFFLARRGVFERLQRAQRGLPPHCRLMIAEALRPLAAQRALQQRVEREIAAAHPAWSTAQVRDTTALYVAAPESVPPHSTGGAVDLSLVSLDGRELPMGSALNAIDPASCTDAPLPDPAARANRALLCRVMREAGFVNYDAEWWHWSYGDRYWAVKAGQAQAIYGSVESDLGLSMSLSNFLRRGRPG